MKRYKLLEMFKEGSSKKPEFLDNVASDFKKMIIDFITENYFNENIKSEKTKQKLTKILESNIKSEYNTLTIPYFQILENINLCIEVEMSETQSIFESNQKFGERKFSEIMASGIDKSEPINRFSISENKFIKSLEKVITEFTKNYEVSQDSIKIEFD